jgi:hypothetical protein
MAGTIATAGLLFGLVPTVELSAETIIPLNFSRDAQAQAVTEDEITNYARSVLAIEPIRRSAYDQIKQITGSSNIPTIACHRPRSLNDLPSEVRQIAVGYCNQAIEIVEQNDLTITRFNAITIAHQEDADLSSRIQQAILQLQ